MTVAESAIRRREPKQQRSLRTVDDVLEAVRLVVKRYGVRALTTNRIAEVAGVSVGSLYQYFPDKRAIFAALHDRHVGDVQQVIGETMTSYASAPLHDFTGELVLGLIDVHADSAELHDIVSSAVPESAVGFRTALHHIFESMLSRRDPEQYGPDERERMLFVLPRLVESLVHGAAWQARALSPDGARREAMRAVQVYVNSF